VRAWCARHDDQLRGVFSRWPTRKVEWSSLKNESHIDAAGTVDRIAHSSVSPVRGIAILQSVRLTAGRNATTLHRPFLTGISFEKADAISPGMHMLIFGRN